MAKKQKERSGPLRNRHLNSLGFEWEPTEGKWVAVSTKGSTDVALLTKLADPHTKGDIVAAVGVLLNDWRFKTAGIFNAPYNTFRSHSTLDGYNRCLRWSKEEASLYFLRFWLDQIIETTGYAIWSHVFNTERELNRADRKRDQIAEEHAERVLREFHSSFF